mgnify:CR=1 FL=1
MIEHLETVHEEEKRIANNENNNTDQRSTGTLCIKRNLAPTNSSDGEFQFFETYLKLISLFKIKIDFERIFFFEKTCMY